MTSKSPRLLALASALVAATCSVQALAKIQPLSVLAQRGGELAAGTYHCRQQYNPAGYTVKVVEIISATQYAWVSGGRQPGTMRYDPATGQLSFTGGPLSTGFEAHLGRRADGKALMILVATDIAPKADAYDYCVRSPSAPAQR